MQAGRHPLGRVVPALHHRNYRIYSAGGALSITGTWMQDVAQGWYVLDNTDSAATLGAVMAAEYLPILLLSPLGGALADRHDTRRLVVLAQVALGLCALFLGIAVSLSASVPVIFALAVARGMASSVDLPSRAAFISEVVPAALIRSAAAFESLIWNIGRTLGPILAAVFITHFSYASCFYVNCFTYLALLVLTLSLDRSSFVPVITTANAQVRDGWHYVRRTAPVRGGLLSLLFIGTFAYNSATIFPLMAKYLFTGEVGAAAQLITAAGVGAIVSNLALVRAGGEPSTRLVVQMTLLYASVIAITGMSPSLPVATVLTFLWGASNAAYAVPVNTLIQVRCDPEFRGRVMAFRQSLIFGSTAIGAPLIGLWAEFISVRFALEAVAAMTAFGALVSWLTFRKATDQPHIDCSRP